MIRKLKSGEYRLTSRKLDPHTGKRRNLGTFASRAVAEKHEQEVAYFKRQCQTGGQGALKALIRVAVAHNRESRT